MNILVIKQTSLGDVLHSTGHIRAIRRQFPEAHITLLTADTSADIYRFNPHVDRIIEFERYRIKDDWLRHPIWVINHFRKTFSKVAERQYDLALDLQGRWKSVLFLYAAKARRKLVKGRWPFLDGFRQRELHALAEMDGVLEKAGINTMDTSMEMVVSEEAQHLARNALTERGWLGGDIAVLSLFTRWPSKNWSLQCYAELIEELSGRFQIVLSGDPKDRNQVEAFMQRLGQHDVINLSGVLDLQGFAALTQLARVVVSGDSFAMHLAVACRTPVVALFGPTDETRVGPSGSNHEILRGKPDCTRCYDRNCERRCIDGITASQVSKAIQRLCPEPE